MPHFEAPKLDTIRKRPDGIDLPRNPQLSSDGGFVEEVSRSGSQDGLDGEGVYFTLYARYTAGGSDLGFYGLEANL